LADKLAETTAILKVSFAPDKDFSGVVPFPLKTEEELDEFENSFTPEHIGLYVSIEQDRLFLHFLIFIFLFLFADKENIKNYLKRTAVKAVQTYHSGRHYKQLQFGRVQREKVPQIPYRVIRSS